tara:strand:- start:4875 stop:5411 length:537 start_codon:yes stop_codon:yes gene_type:complete
LSKPNVIKLAQFGANRERKAKGGIVLDIRDANLDDPDSDILVAGERDIYPDGALSWLYEHGKLGRKDRKNTHRRYDVGIWFRQLWLKCHNSRITSGWGDVRGGKHQMSEAKLWNLECLKDTLCWLGARQRVLVAVAVDDHRPTDCTHLKAVLDALAKHRDLAGGRDQEITDRVGKEFA